MTAIKNETATARWLERDRRVLAGTLGRATDVVADHGEGAWLVDVEGRRFLDFTCGIAVTNLGHGHPDVLRAAEAQMRRIVHTSIVTHHQRNIELAERLCGLVPYIDDAQVFFCNSGAEAIDGVIKMARRVTGRPGLIAFRGAFHGRTLGATSLTTAKAKYREGYEPLMAGVTIAPYAAPLRMGDDAAANALAALDEILLHQTMPSQIAAMVVEPVLGEGGYIVPPVAWLRGLRERCDRHGILLVFDEVQTGIGRTGAPFAAETFDVRPDVIVFAKAIASGFPLGGIIASRALFDRWPRGTHGSTFGGNPVACAAALATLDVLERDGLYRRCRELGGRARGLLTEATRNCAGVLEVRGVGLMIGVECIDAETAGNVRRACLADGLLVLTCGPTESVLRVIPPLIVTDEELSLGIDILMRALQAHA